MTIFFLKTDNGCSDYTALTKIRLSANIDGPCNFSHFRFIQQNYLCHHSRKGVLAPSRGRLMAGGLRIVVAALKEIISQTSQYVFEDKTKISQFD